MTPKFPTPTALRRAAGAVLAAALMFGASAAAVYAQSLSTTPVDSIVAVVDEDVILRSELDQAVANIRAQYRGQNEALPPTEVLERQVLDRLILMRLQVTRAEDNGIRISDAELDQTVSGIAQQNGISTDSMRAQLAADGMSFSGFRETLRDELTVQRLRQALTQSRVNVSDAEVDVELASQANSGGQVHLSDILVAVDDGASPLDVEAAKSKVADIKRQIDGGLAFEAAAIRYSDAPNALDGGDLGWRNVNEVPRLFTEVVKTQPVGTVTEPMRGPSGFHLLKITERRDENERQTATEYHAQSIVILRSELVPDAEAHARIDAARERVTSGGEDFGSVAKEVSEDTRTRDLNGDMGWFKADDYGASVARVITTLEDGEVSQPFPSNVGWHLIKRLGVREQDVTEELRRAQARETVGKRKAEEEYESFLRQLRSEAYIENRLTG
ncbi:MAG: peptidylprolyl isomerase [Xanthomonadales bacterium]|nr:peptidylprolyl isomerase [Xanthomonadales bacterium]